MGTDVGMGDGSVSGGSPAGCTARVAEVMVSGVVVAPIAYVSGKKICGMGEEMHLYGIVGPSSDARCLCGYGKKPGLSRQLV